MGRKTVAVADARRELPAMLDGLERGDTYLITRHGKPVGELRPAPKEQPEPSEEFGICALAGSGSVRLPNSMIDRIVAELREGKQIIDLGAKDGILRLSAREAIDHLVTLNRRTLTLTRRELQIVRLLADGKTNREIAELLVLSERTVEGHVANILAKLGVKARSDAGALGRASIAVSVRFRITTRLGYTFETHGQDVLREITDASEAPRNVVHACDTPSGTVYIPAWSVGTVAVDPLTFDDRDAVAEENLTRAVRDV